MNLLWFYVAIVLAVSDVLHTQIMWKVFNNFYIILGGLIQQTTKTTWQTWLAHETMEAGFHFIVLSIVFLNPVVGIQAALIHFVIESLFFILIYGF